MKTLIQLGSNVGNDDFQEICNKIEEKSKIVLIEANQNLIPKLKENYSNLENKHDIIYINNAIVPVKDSDYVDLYFTSNDGLSSLVNRNSYWLTDKIKVKANTINEIINDLDIREIDELHIDIEGLDYEVLLSLDIDKYNFKLITCEIWPYSDDDKNNKFRTGPSLLNQIFDKFKNYDITEFSFSGMPSLKLTKK
jgi:hypothetical protein